MPTDLEDTPAVSPAEEEPQPEAPQEDPAAQPDPADNESGEPSPELIAAQQAADQAARNREGFDRRKLEEQLQAAKRDLEVFKRRDDAARKAKLTEEQRLREERDTATARLDSLEREMRQQKIAREFRLPDELASRLQGSDEEAMRADAQNLAKFVTTRRVGTPTDPIREGGPNQPTFTRKQIADFKFFKDNEKAIRQAAKEGRITS